MDVIIDYDGNEIITNETCSICLEELNNVNDTHELNECKHKFHSKCLITYLRTGNRTCPLCRGNANEFFYINPYISHDNNTAVSAVIKYTKKKNANKQIKKLVERYKNLKKKYKDAKNNSSILRKELKANKEYQELTKKRNKTRNNEWNAFRKVKKIERQLSKIVMLPFRV